MRSTIVISLKYKIGRFHFAELSFQESINSAPTLEVCSK